MTEKRFTDREIGLILRRAVELEEDSPSSGLPAARGLTLKELEEIAREAGIDPAMVGRAAKELEGKKGLEPPSFFGPSPVKREVRVIPGELSQEAVGELIRVVDDEVEAQGNVAEALGGVRWTSNTRFLSTQVSVEPSGDDTLLRVEERYSEQVRGPLHGIPTAWASIISLPLGLETLHLAWPIMIVFTAVLAMVGWGTGDLIWRGLVAASRRRVGALSERLATEATRLLPSPGEEEG